LKIREAGSEPETHWKQRGMIKAGMAAKFPADIPYLSVRLMNPTKMEIEYSLSG